jgi:hypothetical protein
VVITFLEVMSFIWLKPMSNRILKPKNCNSRLQP